MMGASRLILVAAIAVFLAFPLKGLVTVTGVEGDEVPNIHDISSFVNSVITRSGASTDREKCIALWGAAVELMPQSPGAYEPLISASQKTAVNDPIILWNVYGFGFCSYDSHMLQACFREIGLNCRNWEISHHTIPEVWFDDGSGVNQPGWHIFDASHERYYTANPDGSGHIASREDMLNEVDASGYCSNYQNYFPGGRVPETNTAQQEFDMYHADLASCFVGYGGRDEFFAGHVMDITLKRGEVFTRYFYDLGDTDDYWIGQIHESGMPEYPNWYLAGFDPSPKAYANGVYEYTPPFDNVRYRDDIEFENNVASVSEDDLSPALHLVSLGTGSVVFKFYSPYIVTSATFSINAVRRNPADSVAVYIRSYEARGASGLDWGTPVWESTGSSPVTATDVSIKDRVRGRYTYLVKITMTTSGAINDVGVESFTLKTIVQNSKLALPRLKPGANTIHVTSAQQACIQSYPQLITDDVFDQAYRYSNMAHRTNTDDYSGILYPVTDDTWGEVVYKFETSGDITSFNFGGAFYMHDAHDVELAYSYDDSNYVTLIDDIYAAGYSPGSGGYVNQNFYVGESSVGAGHREIYFRYRFIHRSGVGGYIGAKDIGMTIYYETPATDLDIQVTYDWDDGGDQTHVETITSADYSYTINTNAALPPNSAQTPFTTFNKFIRMELVETDGDSDGLPDAWEMRYFGNLDENAGGDFDGDTSTNLEEYQADSDPTDPLSHPSPQPAVTAKSTSHSGCAVTGHTGGSSVWVVLGLFIITGIIGRVAVSRISR